MNEEIIGRLYEEAGLLKSSWLWLVNHQLGASHVAGLLAQLLNPHVAVDKEIAEMAAALHDIGKVFSKDSQSNVICGVNFITGRGIPENIISCVKKHQFWSFPLPKRKELMPESWEEKIVFLSDVIFSSSIEKMETRVADIAKRYQQMTPPGGINHLVETSKEIYQTILQIIKPLALPF